MKVRADKAEAELRMLSKVDSSKIMFTPTNNPASQQRNSFFQFSKQDLQTFADSSIFSPNSFEAADVPSRVKSYAFNN